MDFTVFTEPQQGATYHQLLAVAQEAETAGFGGFFRSDHYLAMGDDATGEPGPTDAWVTLAGLARETSTIRLGTLVTAATFRHPAPLAISVAQVDDMSDGRVELGIGTGWYDAEHAAYGLPFPPLGERFEVLTEQLEIITGLWAAETGETLDHDGEHYQLSSAPAGLIRPAQRPGPPIIIGGWGAKKTPALAARFAAEFNLPFAPLDAYRPQCDVVRAACEAAGRDSGDMTYSVAQVVCCAEDEGGLIRRAANIGRDLDELRENGLAGTPSEVIAKLGAWAEAGAERVHMQVLDVTDTDHVALLGAEVLPALAGG